MRGFKILQIAKEIRGCRAAVNQKVRAADESSATAHQKFGKVADFIGRTGSSCRRGFQHIAIAFTARTFEFVGGKRRYDYSGAD